MFSTHKSILIPPFSAEHKNWRWHPFEAALEMLSFENNANCLKAAQACIAHTEKPHEYQPV
jgi:hypothetical protein